MKPLIVLIATWIIALFILKGYKGSYEWAFAGRIALAVMLLFTSIAHFVYSDGMTGMIPHSVPFKTELVYLTGVIEIAAAIGILIPSMQVLTGWLLIVFLILILPANISAAFRHMDYQKGTTDGNGPMYLFFRIPLQILFIAWTYFSFIK